LGNLSVKESLTREFQGATVAFKEGAEVASITLLSDFSSIQLADLPSNAQPVAVAEMLASFGIEIPLTAVQLKPTKPSGSIATIKFDGPNTAQLVVDTIEKATNDGEAGELSIVVVKGVAKFGSRLQLSSVNCSWVLPHRKATLYYDEATDIIDAFRRLENVGRILGRSIKCFDPALRPKNGDFVMQVTGLPVNVREADILRLLPADIRPYEIKSGLSINQIKTKNILIAVIVGEPTYEESADFTTAEIHAALRRAGPVEYFHRHDVAEGSR
jgi:hypothetical protein